MVGHHKIAMKLSVIIPTRNRVTLLEKALKSLLVQTFSQVHFEIIVVDNGPSEEAAEVSRKFQGAIKNLRYVIEPSPGLHNARHSGMREARSEFLVYVDDDIEASPGWLEGVWEGFTKYSAALVCGKNLPKWETEPPAWLKKLWEATADGKRSLGYLSVLDFGNEVMEINPSFVWGCNFSIRKSTLLEAGGFHPDSMPSDLLHMRGDGECHVTSFVGARGYKTIYMPAACVHHLVPRGRMTVDYFRKRAFSQGVSDSYARLRNNPEITNDIVPKLNTLGKLMSIVPLRRLRSYLLPSDVYVRSTVDEAYREGFNWHLHRFLNDEEIRSWVLRENYLDV